MRVLVTGGAGFIGSHLADRLIARGDEVIVIDNLETGIAGNLPDTASLQFYRASIADRDVVRSVAESHRPTVCVHAAATYKDPEDWSGATRTNVLGTHNVVQAAAECGCRRLIYLQTSLCYGPSPAALPIPLDARLDPRGAYAATKTIGEELVRLFSREWMSLRLANIYGPRSLSGPVPNFYVRIKAGQKVYVADTRRDFVFIDDLVELLEMAVDSREVGLYHASSGYDIGIGELYETVADELGAEPTGTIVPRDTEDVAALRLDPEKTRRTFDWHPSTPLGEGVHAAIQYYSAHDVQTVYSHLTRPYWSTGAD